jgi:hypothetical protein
MDHSPGGSEHFWKYLIGQPSRQVRELLAATTILDFAIAAITIFEPIYLFKLGFSIPQILFFYIGVYGLYLLIQPFGGKVTRSQGYKHGIIFSTPFLILYYLSLFAIPYSPLFIATAIVAYAIQKTLYWPGFHADFAKFGSVSDSGREFGLLVFLISLVSVVGPFFGGLVIRLFSFPTLFVIVSLLILVSNIPLLLPPGVFVPRDLSYLDAYKRLLKPENRCTVLSFMGYGEELLALTIWPIAIFLAIDGFTEIGALISISTLITAVVGYLIGRGGDGHGRVNDFKILRIGTIMTALSWVMRIAAFGPFTILGIDTLYRTSRMAQGVPMMTLTYEAARHYSVTKTAILIEMAVIVGKLTLGIATALVFLFLPDQAWGITFALAAAFSLLYLVYRPFPAGSRE